MSLIAVHGATGFTGGLICHELGRRGIDFAIAGRNESKLTALATTLAETYEVDTAIRVVPALEPAALDEMLAGVGVLINCVGPFVEYGKPVVEAAIRANAHYFDTTGEQSFMYDLKKDFHQAAQDAEVALCPGCAYEYSTGDCAAALLAQHGVRNIVVGYAVTSSETSRGTKKSIVEIMTKPGRTLVGGELVERKPGYETYAVPVGDRELAAVWIPGGEALTVPEHHPDVDSVETCLVVGATMSKAIAAASPIIPATAGVLRPLLYKIIEHTNPDPHEQADEISRFAVVAFDPSHPDSRVEVKGEDPYSLTAHVIVEAATRLSETPAARVGFTSPAGLFEPRELLESIGCRIDDLVSDG